MSTLKYAVAVFASLAGGACFCHTSPGEGEKIGQIVKVSRVGMIWPTWEAQLIRGGMTDGSGTVGVAPFDFTVEGDSLVALVREAMASQTEVIVTYRVEGVCAWNRTEAWCTFLSGIRAKEAP